MNLESSLKLPPGSIALYVSRRKEDLKACLLAFEERDFRAIEKIAHKIKGNGLTFGFPELSKIGAAAEAAAQEKNISSLKEALVEFNDWVVASPALAPSELRL